MRGGEGAEVGGASGESYNLWRGSDSTLQGKGAGEDEISLRDVHLQREPWRPGACALGSVGAEVRCWDVRPQHPKSVMPVVRFERSTWEQFIYKQFRPHLGKIREVCHLSGVPWHTSQTGWWPRANTIT